MNLTIYSYFKCVCFEISSVCFVMWLLQVSNQLYQKNDANKNCRKFNKKYVLFEAFFRRFVKRLDFFQEPIFDRAVGGEGSEFTYTKVGTFDF